MEGTKLIQAGVDRDSYVGQFGAVLYVLWGEQGVHWDDEVEGFDGVEWTDSAYYHQN